MPIYIMSSRLSLKVRHYTYLPSFILLWTLDRDANWQTSGSPRYSFNRADEKKRALECLSFWKSQRSDLNPIQGRRRPL
jgi:hypothetical protein